MHTETPNVSKNTRKISCNLLWITNFSKIVTYGQYITINTVLSFVLLQEVQLIPNYLFDSNSNTVLLPKVSPFATFPKSRKCYSLCTSETEQSKE